MGILDSSTLGGAGTSDIPKALSYNRVKYMRQSGRVLAERIVREHRAGKHDIDIIGTSAVTFADREGIQWSIEELELSRLEHLSAALNSQIY